VCQEAKPCLEAPVIVDVTSICFVTMDRVSARAARARTGYDVEVISDNSAIDSIGTIVGPTGYGFNCVKERVYSAYVATKRCYSRIQS